MPQRLIHQTSLKAGRPIEAGGQSLVDIYNRLAELIRVRLSEADLKFLALPELDKDAGRIDWQVELPGLIRPFASLNLTEQGAVLTSLSRFQSRVAVLAAGLKRDSGAHTETSELPPSTGPIDHPPGGVSNYNPVDDLLSRLFDDLDQEALYLVGNQPVMAGWGLAVITTAEALPSATAAALKPAAVAAEAAPPRRPGCLPVGLGFGLSLLLSGLLSFLILYFLSPDAWRLITGRQPWPRLDQAAFDSNEEETNRLRQELAKLKRDYDAEKALCQPEEPQAEAVKPAPPPPKAPQKAPQPKEAAPSPKSNKLIIPKEAARRNDLSFLEGCWRSVTGIRNNSGDSLITEYCFNKKGQGTSRTIELTRRGGKAKQVCPSSAWAVFEGSRLVIRENPNICPDGRRYLPTVIECSRTESAASCHGVNMDKQGQPGSKWSARIERSR